MTSTQEHLTDFERAIFYYTLPRLRTPFPVGVTALYAAAMLLAVATIVYGVSTGELHGMRCAANGASTGAVKCMRSASC